MRRTVGRPTRRVGPVAVGPGIGCVVVGGIGQGDHARHMAQRPVQPEFTAEGEPVGTARRKLARRHEDADRDGQVEPGTAFAYAGGREVDGHPAHRPRQATREQRGTHAVARLAHGRIGQTHDGEPRQAIGDMDFDRDPPTDRAGQRGGGNGSEHAQERSPAVPFRDSPPAIRVPFRHALRRRGESVSSGDGAGQRPPGRCS